MKILTVRQPFASAIFGTVGAKDIENRRFQTHLRGRIGIHAGLAWYDSQPVETTAPFLPRGFILGTVQLIGCHLAGSADCAFARCGSSFWAEPGEDVWHWELSSPREFVTPIRAKGQLGFWEPGPSDSYLMEIAELVESYSANT